VLIDLMLQSATPITSSPLPLHCIVSFLAVRLQLLNKLELRVDLKFCELIVLQNNCTMEAVSSVAERNTSDRFTTRSNGTEVHN